jgi:GNAT superfamily N-acetyltransferase
MNEIHIIPLHNPFDERWIAVECLFSEMYSEMDDMGLQLPLVPGGAAKWVSMARNTTGKFGLVALAMTGDRVAGFAHGQVRFLPDYLGGYPIGAVTHVFVERDLRKLGIARQLVEVLEKWLSERKVHSVELQVISGNPASSFWSKLGYQPELSQYRKLLP